MKNKQLLFKILNKIFNILNFRYFLLAKFLAKYFFFTNYNSKELNNYKIEIPIFQWRGKNMLRFSFNAYNDKKDSNILINAVEDIFSK